MYLIVKSLHLISLVAWFAGLFYIFRLFVYHVENKSLASVHSLFLIMERRLFRYIILPASASTLLFGLILSYLNPMVWASLWFYFKLAFVAALYWYQLRAAFFIKNFSRGDFLGSSKYFRMMNELPTIVLIVVVFLVVLKPH